jgi:hypothetical protein
MHPKEAVFATGDIKGVITVWYVRVPWSSGIVKEGAGRAGGQEDEA